MQLVLLLADGTLRFTGSPIINTTFDSASNKGGHIMIGDGNNAVTFDFSGSDNMQIVLTANSTLPAVGNKYQYTLFATKNNGIVTPIIDNSKISFIANEQHRYLTWFYNPSTYVISSQTDVSSLPQNVANNNGSSAAQI
ncbi:hypothetical protein [Candidatus Trichorickettsia mobilis]|uniref:hypothetical protein n=1 Tax=Candidatus Trichorickettsia mobilis TaxID=1346319 RepID=UPI00292F3A3A|nr:hypothetical protein [Candidatus Trichorickettsia mobilis]